MLKANAEVIYMQRILLALRQAWPQRILVIGLMLLLSLSGLFIFVSAPVYATTLEEMKLKPTDEGRLTPEQKIEHAYEFGQASGAMEERKQEGLKAERTGIKDKGDDESLQFYEAKPEPTLVEKAQKLVEKVTGKD
jgi:hypothetical protein